MRSTLLAASLLGVAVVAGCDSKPAADGQPAAAVVPADATKVVFNVPDMH